MRHLTAFTRLTANTLLGLTLAWCAQTAMAAAVPEADTGHVRAKLVASTGSVHAGDQVTVGLNQRIIEHWHTYWTNPGDSGLATTIEWTLPAGASAGDIQWPIPHRFKIGPVTNHGYEREVTLLSPITVPKDARPGSSFPIEAKVNWLVCQDTCIPQEVHLSLSLPVVAHGQPTTPGSPLIAQARAQLPVASPWKVEAQAHAHGVALRIPDPALGTSQVKELWFYPLAWGHVAHNVDQTREADAQGVILRLQAGEAPPQPGQALAGVLVVTQADAQGGEIRRGYEVSVTVPPGGAPAATASPAPSTDVAGVDKPPAAATDEAPIGLGLALVLALLGGLVLNLMPCVFPVLSIKALALLSHSDQTPRQARLHGLAYTGGVLASFALLAALLVAVKAGGAQVGWGFQFQSPLFVLAVAYLMFAVGLSLSGVFTIGGSVTGVGSSLANRSGYTGSFFTGVLATVVATPCTAPFMGGAVGFALTQPTPALLAVFLSLGFGLALPYLLLSTWPALQRWLPRPGLWMERVKQALAFPMYGAAAWLVWVLAQQAGIDSVAAALGGMVLIAFAAWAYDSARGAAVTLARRSGLGLAGVALVVAVVGTGLAVRSGEAASGGTSLAAKGKPEGGWEPYSVAKFDALRAKGQPVFLNFTAAWCITCLVNERVALSKAPVAEAFKAQGITYLKGDWTRQDPQISQVLEKFGRSGVPLYVYYPQGLDSKPVVLPQILTPDLVVAAVKEGAPAVTSSLNP
ncbi:MAG TPA: thioredoxin family protein [Candidatus Aquabacterium excrementipullorum]|nr:thioredoxin family protein [Candidatus Aquabacterium excrementipullorum]